MKRIRIIMIFLAVVSVGWPAFKIYDRAVVYPRQVDKCWNGNRSIKNRKAICTQLIERKGLSAGKRRRDLRGRAWFYIRTNDFDGALHDAQSMLDIKPDDPWAWIVRGEVYVKQEKWDDAVAAMTKAVKEHPKKVDPIHRRARLFRRKGDYDLAMQDYGAVLELKPKHFNALKQRVRMFVLLGDYDGALRHAQDAAKVLPDESWFHEALSYLYALHVKDDVRALSAFEDALALSESEWSTAHLAFLHFRAGNDAQGHKLVQKIGVLGSQYIEDGLNPLILTLGKVTIAKITKHKNVMVESIMYSVIGQTDLARERMYRFIELVGANGRPFVWRVMGQQGEPETEDKFAQVLDDYIQNKKIGFSLDWFERN